MTQPTPGYSWQGPNSVIGHRPAGLDWRHHLELAAGGHQELLAAVHADAHADHVRRDIGRQGLADEDVQGGPVGEQPGY
jgi:hypothetical protein